MWKITQHRTPKGTQETRLKLLIDEMALASHTKTPEAFSNQFLELVKEIPDHDGKAAENMFKPLIRKDGFTVEVWRVSFRGVYNYPIFSLKYVNTNT